MTATEAPVGVRGKHSRRRAPVRRRFPVWPVAVLVLLAVAAAGVLAWQHREVRAEEQARSEAVAAARSAASDILGYDYRTIDDDITRARGRTTGAFRKQYDTTATTLLPRAKQVKAIVQATVGSAGVMSADGDRVVVLLFVDQATVKQEPGAKTPVTRIDQTRVRLTMTRTDDRWLVSELSAL